MDKKNKKVNEQIFNKLNQLKKEASNLLKQPKKEKNIIEEVAKQVIQKSKKTRADIAILESDINIPKKDKLYRQDDEAQSLMASTSANPTLTRTDDTKINQINEIANSTKEEKFNDPRYQIDKERQAMWKGFLKQKYGDENYTKATLADAKEFDEIKRKWDYQNDPKRNKDHKNHSDSPFKDTFKTNWELGDVEEKIKESGWKKNELPSQIEQLKELRKQATQSKDGMVYVPNSIINADKETGKRDYISDITGMETSYSEEDYNTKMSAFSIHKLIIEKEQEIERANKDLEKNKVLYNEYNQRIEDLNKQLNPLQKPIAMVGGGLTQVLTDEYKAKNMGVAVGASMGIGAVAGAFGASASTAGALDLLGDITVGGIQDVSDKIHMVKTMEDRDLTFEEYLDTIAMSITTNITFRYATPMVFKGVGKTIKGGYKLTGRVFNYADDKLFHFVRDTLGKELSPSDIVKHGDLSYQYNPLTRQVEEVFLNKNTVDAIKRTAQKVTENGEDYVEKVFREDNLSYAKRKADIGLQATKGTEFNTYTKVEVDDAVNKLGKEFDDVVENKTILDNIKKEVDKNRKNKTKIKNIQKEIDGAKDLIDNPQLQNELNGILDKFKNKELNYQQALKRIYDLKKAQYIDDNLDVTINASRNLNPNKSDMINNLPPQYKKIKDEFNKREDFINKSDIDLDNLPQELDDFYTDLYSKSKLFKKVEKELAGLDNETKMQIHNEMKKRFAAEYNYKLNVTKENIIQTSGELHEAFTKIDNELNEQHIKMKEAAQKLKEEENKFEQMKQKQTTKNSAGDDVEPEPETSNNTNEGARMDANDTTNKEKDTSNINPDEEAPQDLEQFVTNYIKDVFERKPKEPKFTDANAEASKVANRPKIQKFEIHNGDKIGASAKLYDYVGKLRDGEYVEYYSDLDNTMTGVTKMGANEYLYQYKISNKSEELIGKKLYNVDQMNSVDDAYIIQLPNSAKEDIVRYKGELGRQFIAMKNARKVTTAYLDNSIRLELGRQQDVRKLSHDTKVEQSDIPTKRNERFATDISTHIVQSVNRQKKAITFALNEQIKAITNREMNLISLFDRNLTSKDLINIFTNDNIMDIVMFLNRNGESASDTLLDGMNLDQVRNIVGSDFFNEHNEFTGITLTDIDGNKFTYSTPEEVALFYSLNEKNMDQIIQNSKYTYNQKMLLKYFYDNTPQERINGVYIEGLPEEAKAIFKSWDKDMPNQITTSDMIKDLSDYIRNADEDSLEALDILNQNHPIFRVNKLEEMQYTGDIIEDVSKRVLKGQNSTIFEFIGSGLYRDGYDKLGMLNELMPVVDALYEKFDILKGKTFDYDVNIVRAVDTANKSSIKRSGRAYHLTAKEAELLRQYGEKIDNKIYSTTTNTVEEIKLSPEQLRESVINDMKNKLNSQDGINLLKREGKKMSPNKIKKLTKTQWFKELDDQINFIYKDNAVVLDEWRSLINNGRYGDVLKNEFKNIKAFNSIDPSKVFDYQDGMIDDGIYIKKTQTNFSTKKTITEVIDDYINDGELKGQRTPELIAVIDQLKNTKKATLDLNQVGEKIKSMQESANTLLDYIKNKKQINEQELLAIKQSPILEFLNKEEAKLYNQWVNKGANMNSVPELIEAKITLLAKEKMLSDSSELFDAFDKTLNKIHKNLFKAKEGKIDLRTGYNNINRLLKAAELGYVEVPDNILTLLNQYNNVGQTINQFLNGKHLRKINGNDNFHMVKGGRLSPSEMAKLTEAMKSINKQQFITNMVKLLNPNEYGMDGKYFSFQMFNERMAKAMGIPYEKGQNVFAETLLGNTKYMDSNTNMFLIGEDLTRLSSEKITELNNKWEDFKLNVYDKYVDDLPQVMDTTTGKLRPQTLQEFYVSMLYVLDDVSNSTAVTWLKDRAGIGKDYTSLGKLANRFDEYKKGIDFVLGFGNDMGAIDIWGAWTRHLDNNLTALAEREALGTDLRTVIKMIRQDVGDEKGRSYFTDETIRQAHKRGMTTDVIQNKQQMEVGIDQTIDSIANRNIDYLDSLMQGQGNKNHLTSEQKVKVRQKTYEYFNGRRNELFLKWNEETGKVEVGIFKDNAAEEMIKLNNFLYDNLDDDYRRLINNVTPIKKSAKEFLSEQSPNVSNYFEKIYEDLKAYSTDSKYDNIILMKGIAKNLENYKNHSKLVYGDNLGNIKGGKLSSTIGMVKGVTLSSVGAGETLLHDGMQIVQGNILKAGLSEVGDAMLNVPSRGLASIVLQGAAIADNYLNYVRFGSLVIGDMVAKYAGTDNIVTRTLSGIAHFPKINKFILDGMIYLKGSKFMREQFQGEYLNHLISVARKGDNGFIYYTNELGRMADNFQGGLEFHKYVWSLNRFDDAIGLDWNDLSRNMRSKLNAFGIDNNTWQTLNDILERVSSKKSLKKSGALWEFMNLDDLTLLQKGLTNEEIRAIRNLNGALDVASFNASHQNKRMLFKSFQNSDGDADILAEQAQVTFFRTARNAFADFWDNLTTVTGKDGTVFSLKEYQLMNGRLKTYAHMGGKLGMTTLVLGAYSIPLAYLSPIYSYIRSFGNEKKKAKAIASMEAFWQDPIQGRILSNLGQVFSNGLIGVDLTATQSAAANLLIDKFIMPGKIAASIVRDLVGNNPSWNEAHYEDNGEKSTWDKLIDANENEYEYIRNKSVLEKAKMFSWSLMGMINEQAHRSLEISIYENGTPMEERSNILADEMLDVKGGSDQVTDVEREYRADDLLQGRSKEEFGVTDLLEQAVPKPLSNFVKTRIQAIKEGMQVKSIDSRGITDEEKDYLEKQNPETDYVLDGQFVRGTIDKIKLKLSDMFSSNGEKEYDSSFASVDEQTINPIEKKEAEWDMKVMVFGIALAKYKKDNNGDLSHITEKELLKYADKAQDELKKEAYNLGRIYMKGEYYEEQMNIIQAYETNYLMGVVPEQQLERTFEEVFSKSEIDKRLNDMFTLTELDWLNKNVINVMGGNKKINRAKLAVISEMVTQSKEDASLEDIQKAMGVDDDLANMEISQEAMNEFKKNMMNEYGIPMSENQIKFMAYSGISPQDLANSRLQAEEFIQYRDEEIGKTPKDEPFDIVPKKEYDARRLAIAVSNIVANPLNVSGIVSGLTNNSEFKQTPPKEKAMEYTGIKEPKKEIKQDNINTQEIPKLSPYAAASEYTQADLDAAINRIPKLHPNDKVKDQNMRTLLKVAAPYAQKYNVPIELILAQFSMESAYGTKVKGKNNYFNMTTGNNWTGSYTTTKNKANGNTYHWRDYNSLEQGVEDFCKWWSRGKINGIPRRNADGSVNLEALKAFAEEGNYYKSILQQMNVMKQRVGSEVYNILGQSNLIAKSYPVDSIELQTYAGENIGTSNTETLSLDTTLQMMGVQPNDEDIDSTLEVKGIHPLARRMIYEYRDYDPKNGDNRVHQYQIQGGNMPDVDGVQDLGWDASIIGYLGSDYITSKSVSAEQLYRNNGIEIKPNEPLESGDLVFLDNKNGDIFHVNVVIAALNNGTVITISGNENEEGMGIKAYNRSDIKKAKRLPMRNDGSVSGARKETK